MKEIATFYLFTLSALLFAQQPASSLLSDAESTGWTHDDNVLLHDTDDGVNVSSSHDMGWITSLTAYDNFHLSGAFLLSPGATAQLAFRVPKDDSPYPAFTGYALQFDRNSDQQNNLGSIINVARAIEPDSLDLGQYNSFDIIAHGDHLLVKIDGKRVAEVHNRRSTRGFFKIGVTGKGITFRDLKVVEIHATYPSSPDIKDFIINFPGFDYKSIFDGRSLEGWTNTGDSKWDISDGVLHGYSGENGGFLISTDEYKNFHFKFKFKIKFEDNSGIFIRKPKGEGVSIENSVECNIYDFNGYTHAYSTGSLATHARAWSKLIDYQDWNTGDIYALGDHIVMYINGNKASEAHLPQFEYKGNICLQAGIKIFTDKGPSDIFFKDLWVKCID